MERVIAYQNRAPKVNQAVSQLTSEEPIDLIIFTSPSAIHHAYEVLGEQEANALLYSSDIACIGSTTAEAAHARGLRVEQPARSSIPNLVEAICAYYGAP